MNCTLLKYGKHSVLGRVMLLCVKFEVELPAVGLLSLSVVSKIVLKNVQDFWQKVAAAMRWSQINKTRLAPFGNSFGKILLFM